jgi:hypothetical protein
MAAEGNLFVVVSRFMASRVGFAHTRACCNIFYSVVLCCTLLLKCCKCCKCCSKTFTTFTTFFTTFTTTTHKTVARDTTYIYQSVIKNAFSCRRTVHCSMHMKQMSDCTKHSQLNKYEEAQCTLIGDRSFSHSATIANVVSCRTAPQKAQCSCHVEVAS